MGTEVFYVVKNLYPHWHYFSNLYIAKDIITPNVAVINWVVLIAACNVDTNFSGKMPKAFKISKNANIIATFTITPTNPAKK